jgi:hypothetical protein
MSGTNSGETKHNFERNILSRVKKLTVKVKMIWIKKTDFPY